MTRPQTTERDTHPKALPLLALLLVGALLAAPLALGDPHGDEATQGWPSPAGWPEYGGNHHRTGHAPLIGPATGDAAPGTGGSDGTELSDRSFSSPVIDHEGNLYVGDISGRVTKLNPGLEVLWESGPIGPELRSSVLVGLGDHVYAAPPANDEEHGDETGDLVALDKETGETVWEIDVGNKAPERGNYIVTAAPAYHPDGFILQSSLDGHLYAVSLEGEQIWRFQTHPEEGDNNRVVSTPAITENGTIYFGSQNGIVYALTPEGEELWSFAARVEADNEMIVAAPAIGDDGTVYIGSRIPRGAVGVLYALDPQGDEKWHTVLDEKLVAPATIRDDGALFIGALDGSFYRLDPTDGSIEWTFNPHDDDPNLDTIVSGVVGPQGGYLFTVAEQAVVDDAGRVYVTYWNVRLDGEFPPQNSRASPVYALDTETGEIEWRNVYDRTQRAPVLMPTIHEDDDGRPHGILYLSGDDGRMRAVGEVSPDPVVLPPPGTPEDPPEAPEDDVTIQPDDLEDDPENETGQDDQDAKQDDDAQDGADDPEDDAANQNNGTHGPTGPKPLLEELPAPHALLVLIAGLSLALLRRQRRRA